MGREGIFVVFKFSFGKVVRVRGNCFAGILFSFSVVYNGSIFIFIL